MREDSTKTVFQETENTWNYFGMGMSLLFFVLALWVVFCLESFCGFSCCCWLSDFRHMDFIKQAGI